MSGPSNKEVEDWVSRIDDITSAVDEILHSDPMDDVARHEAREKKWKARAEADEAAKLQQIKMRYEPKNYARFERDDFIDQMLKAVDEKPVEKDYYDLKDEALFTKAERISLEEARRLKEDGAKQVQQGNWEKAFQNYDGAIKLAPVDPKLVVVLHNNRALASNKLGKYIQACEDASFVVSREPRNVKALLRRATALRYLHRPVEALEDVSQALRFEPNNSEGLMLRSWLCRAEEELIRSHRFIEDTSKNNKKEAEDLCNAAEQLAQQREGDPHLDECSKSLQVAFRVIQEYSTGASVLFALRGGVANTLALATSLSKICETSELVLHPDVEKDVQREKEPTSFASPLLLSLRLLANLFDGCETVSQDAPEEAVKALLERMNSLLRLFVEQKRKEKGVVHPLFQTIVNAVLECLTSLYAPYTELVNSMLEAEWKPLTSLWMIISSSSAEAKTTTSMDLVTLFQYTRLITASMHARGASVALAPPYLHRDTLTVTDQLFRPSVTKERPDGLERHSEMILEVVRHCLHDGVPLPIQTVGVTLALKRTAMSVTSDTSGEGRVIPAQFTEKAWSTHLCASMTSALRLCEEAPLDQPHHLRFLEACYSLLFNLAIAAPDRETFVRMWEGMITPTLGCRTWDFVAKHFTNTDSALSPVLSKMLGVLSKFVYKDEPLRVLMQTPGSGPGSLPPLWQMLESTSSSCTALSKSNESQWETLEHLTTILAILHSRPMRVDETTEKGIQQRGIQSLLTVISLSSTPTEAGVKLWKASATSRTSAATSSPSLKWTLSIVALGNASILVGFLMDTVRQPDQRSAVNAVLTECKAMDVLLSALRETRGSALLLAHEKADAESQRMTGTLSQLQLWETQSLTAQKNLGIAVSKVATSSDEMRHRLRDLNGVETLAAILGK